MTILEIVFKKIDGSDIRTVTFNKTGLSVVYGKVVNDSNLKESTNGVGKTIVMQSINYLYGANSSSTIYDKLSDYKIEAKVIIGGAEHIVSRELKKDGVICFDDVPLSLEEYKNKIGADRSCLNKLILLQNRNEVYETPGIAYNSNDLVSIFRLLRFEDISSMIKEINSEKQEYQNISKSIKQLLCLMEINERDINSKVLINEQRLKEEKDKESNLVESIKSLSIDEANAGIQSSFEIDNREIKRVRKESFGYQSELKQLEDYLLISSDFSLSASEIRDIYQESQIAIPERVFSTLSEVEEFYAKVIDDRKNAISKRINRLNALIKQNEEIINELSKNLAEKSAILSKNDAYQNSIVLLSDIQNNIETLSIEKGRFEQYKELNKKRSTLSDEIKSLYNEIDKQQKQAAERIDEYKQFVLFSSTRLYDDDEASLIVDFKNFNLKSLPVSFDITLRKEHSGGVSQVKNILFDYLLYKYDCLNNILLHDSNCFNDIDTRQVATLLTIGNEIAKTKNGQYIVALNEYDIHSSVSKLIEDSIVLELSDEDLLLGEKF